MKNLAPNSPGLPSSSADVIFAVLPFCQLAPALAASTLATALKEEDGIETKVIYFNRLFAQQTGGEFYHSAAASVALNGLLGDWVFREAVFGPIDDRSYFKSLVSRGYITSETVASALRAKSDVLPFLTGCISGVDWSSVKVLCFVETHAKRDAVSGQLMSSLAFAKTLKETHPHVKIILAAAATELEMGEALEQLPFIDFVCKTEIYENVYTAVCSYLSGYKLNRDANSVENKRFRLNISRRRGLLRTPIPNFDDYFALKHDGLPGDFDSIPMEASQGCWWAERNHCSFCALPGGNSAFYSKSPERFLSEFRVQLEKYRPKQIEMNDLIIDQNYFSDVFPKMTDMKHNVEIFFETKTHLKRDQLEIIARAGVRKVQAGLETLSASTLKRISKGVSVGANLRFLSDCAELGIKCYWNYLHSFPGETDDELLEALPVIENATNLQPPATFQPVRLERFSPYFRNPTSYGIDSWRPDQSYHHLFGDTDLDLNKLAFYYEHSEGAVNRQTRAMSVTRLRGRLESWCSQTKHSDGRVISFS